MRAVRPMTVDDLDMVPAVERDAGARFRAVADARIARCADAEPFSAAELLPYVDAGQAWVALEDDELVGFVVVERSKARPTWRRSRSRPARGGAATAPRSWTRSTVGRRPPVSRR